jgi:hypothetical protein
MPHGFAVAIVTEFIKAALQLIEKKSDRFLAHGFCYIPQVLTRQ